MAAAGITPASIAANYIRPMWDSQFKLKANEEPVIAGDIPKADTEDGGKVGDTIYARIIPNVTVQTATTSSEMGPEALTYETGTALRVSGTPVSKYVALEIPITTSSKLVKSEYAALRAGYRQQMRRGLDEAMDANAASVLSQLASNVRGPGNYDKAALLGDVWSLRTAGKEHIKNGTTIHLKYHPSQGQNITTIAEIANADARGDSENPNVKGIVMKAWGLTLAETGNIANSGGNYWNMMFAESAFAKGFNFEPGVPKAESTMGVDRFFAFGEWAFFEVFDADHLVRKTA